LSGKYSRALALATLLAASAGLIGATAPPDDRVLPVAQYTTEKGRTLAKTYARDLREINTGIYHCIPWVELQKESIGFFRPKHLTGDDRYLSLRIYIEQDPSPAFARLAVEERASAMFSRYVGPLLRRMTKSPALLADSSVDGFTIILEWLKQAASAAGERPVHETIAVFVPKALTADYIAGRATTADIAARARVLGWDGETPLGQLKLSAWDDNFVATHKVKNYQLEPGVTCQ
jgi:hypothetical protein